MTTLETTITQDLESLDVRILLKLEYFQIET